MNNKTEETSGGFTEKKVRLSNGTIKTLHMATLNIEKIQQILERHTGLRFSKKTDYYSQAVGIATAWMLRHGARNKYNPDVMHACKCLIAQYYIEKYNGNLAFDFNTREVLVYVSHPHGDYLINAEMDFMVTCVSGKIKKNKPIIPVETVPTTDGTDQCRIHLSKTETKETIID